jgi:hypothetical protein
MTIQLRDVTDTDRADAVRFAVQRELGRGELTTGTWDEIKDRSLASLLAENTGALVDDLYEEEEGSSDEALTGLLLAIKTGSELLEFDYLGPVLEHLGGRWTR